MSPAGYMLLGAVWIIIIQQLGKLAERAGQRWARRRPYYHATYTIAEVSEAEIWLDWWHHFWDEFGNAVDELWRD